MHPVEHDSDDTAIKIEPIPFHKQLNRRQELALKLLVIRLPRKELPIGLRVGIKALICKPIPKPPNVTKHNKAKKANPKADQYIEESYPDALHQRVQTNNRQSERILQILRMDFKQVSHETRCLFCWDYQDGLMRKEEVADLVK